ncbi:siderophore ABC transporter substrate-binding protein [Xylanimonas protaetiae]|uniref:Siderophore ABC transporter substrate-binding protein n=1 Tax=Xylanimonas protaetiae TaxID=2509457 RepID=A0A4P6F7B1_9MICO|nr:siderophore ABC transporter substrate-binding protein [Xylanimonas protaetiae]QAY71375.1 siderophore ABC transporter substrate-binding protein [Xylanimonas protaetiae]
MSQPRTALRRIATAVVPATLAALALSACSAEPGASPAPDAAAGAAEQIVVEHRQGTTTLDGVPETVFAFSWDVVAVLQALDVPVHGVPKRIVPPGFEDLAADPAVVDVGTLFEPDFETIAADPADLLIVAQRSAPMLGELSRIAPTIDLTIDATDNVTQSKATARQLGEIFGRQAEAEALVADLAASLEAVRAASADAGDALVVLTTGGNVTAFGPGGRFGIVHDALGFAPAAAITEDGRHGQAISFEFLLETDPAWLFVIDRDAAIQSGGEAARAVLDNEIVRRTQAYQNDRIVFVDTTSWYIAGTGVVGVQNLLDEVAGVLAADQA